MTPPQPLQKWKSQICPRIDTSVVMEPTKIQLSSSLSLQNLLSWKKHHSPPPPKKRLNPQLSGLSSTTRIILRQMWESSMVTCISLPNTLSRRVTLVISPLPGARMMPTSHKRMDYLSLLMWAHPYTSHLIPLMRSHLLTRENTILKIRLWQLEPRFGLQTPFSTWDLIHSRVRRHVRHHPINATGRLTS